MSYNIFLVSAGSFIWTLFLRAVARRLTKGINSTTHPFLIAGLCVFSTLIFGYGTLLINSHYLFAYFLFFSALVITMFTDATTLLISRLVTIYVMPVGWILSNTSFLPISPLESIIGSFCGLLLLWAIRTISRKTLGKDGLGQGDIDLMCFMGAFIGPIGCWISLMAGSIIGSLIGIFYLIKQKGNTAILLPFGLFLGMGGALYVLFQSALTNLFIPQF